MLHVSWSVSNLGCYCRYCLLFVSSVLKAYKLYSGNGKIPEGEEDYLFQYSVVKVNPDCRTAVVEFNSQYVIEGGYKFHNYTITDDDEDTDIPDYSLSHLEEDHEAYNEHLGRGNKIINDQEHAKRKAEEAAVVRVATDVSDLKAKFDNKAEPFSLMVAEFESQGEVMEHAITSGPHLGKINFKQQWRHKHSEYSFLWHHQLGKSSFQRDRLYKAVRVIINKRDNGHERLSLIMQYSDMPTSSTSEHAKYPRDVDMVNRVLAVFAAVGCKLPLSVFDNHHFTSYVKSLDSKHCPPHRLERMRILEVMIDGAMMEFSRIVKVRHYDFYVNINQLFIVCLT